MIPFLQERGLSLQDLARLAELPYRTVRSMAHGADTRIDYALRISQVLATSVEDLFRLEEPRAYTTGEATR